MKRGRRVLLWSSVAGIVGAAGGWQALQDPRSGIYPAVVMPLLTSKWLDPELSHKLAVRSAALGLTPFHKVSLHPKDWIEQQRKISPNVII